MLDAMKLSTQLQYGDDPVGQIQAVAEWEKAGLDIVYVAEAYGFDGVPQLGYIAAETERLRDRLGDSPDVLPHADPAWR